MKFTPMTRMGGLHNAWGKLNGDEHPDAWLLEDAECDACRDGFVEAPISGADPHGVHASAPCPECHGTGLAGVEWRCESEPELLSDTPHQHETCGLVLVITLERSG